ncbi:MAG: REP-associated tyrosine transposase [Verrucomicrobiota bacterium]|jgi:REP element-mobilizing transposase RayT
MTAEPPNNKPRTERLRRLNRIFPASPVYFLTTCTFNRKSLLATRKVHDAFLEFAHAGEAHGAYIGSYVLMPDHLHLFVALAQDRTLSDWMKSLKNSLSKSMKQSGIPAPHWQKGFFDHLLRSAESYSQKWEYVRDNPVRAGLAKSWEEWPFRGEVWELEYRE